MEKDPVCGMEINEGDAARRSDYEGKTYYFCCDHCKKTFDKEPGAYTEAEHSGHETHHHH